MKYFELIVILSISFIFITSCTRDANNKAISNNNYDSKVSNIYNMISRLHIIDFSQKDYQATINYNLENLSFLQAFDFQLTYLNCMPKFTYFNNRFDIDNHKLLLYCGTTFSTLQNKNYNFILIRANNKSKLAYIIWNSVPKLSIRKKSEKYIFSNHLIIYDWVISENTDTVFTSLSKETIRTNFITNSLTKVATPSSLQIFVDSNATSYRDLLSKVQFVFN